MRKQHTLLALALGAMFMELGNTKLANIQESSANRSMGNQPIFGPTKSQMIKNKINRKRYSK